MANTQFPKPISPGPAWPFRGAAQQKTLPPRVPLAEARLGEELVKLSTERKHHDQPVRFLRGKLRLRQVTRRFVRWTAKLDGRPVKYLLTLSPLSSLHRSQAVAALCETLNQAQTCFPGTNLRMEFAVAGHPK